MSGVSEASGRPRPRKYRAAAKRVDRVSELPEAIIMHILSLLPTTEDRIRTGALSRRWKDLWTCIPKLYFSFEYDFDEVNQSALGDFVEPVQKTLNRILSCGTKVTEFVMKCPFHDDFSSDVDEFVRFAARFQTDKFELDLCPWDGHCYGLPEDIYTNSYLKELRFYYCEVVPSGTVSWHSLKKLTIEFGDVCYNESLENIVAGAPALEFLHLQLCEGISKLDFSNSLVLKKLILHIEGWCIRENKEAAFEISAPSVESLELSCRFRTCKLVDMTSLVEATLFGVDETWDGYPIVTEEVVSSLLNVKNLTVGTWVIQGIAMLPTSPLFPNCKILTVDTHLWKEDPMAIAGLLKSTPQVETLMVTMSKFDSKEKFRNPSRHGNCYIDRYWTSQEMDANYLTCLRTVKFIGFWAYRTVAFPFLQFLLQNVRGLQKVTIDFETEGLLLEISPTEVFETSQKLLSFPRSSPDAKILILPMRRVRWVLK